MNTPTSDYLIHQSVYAKQLRPLLPTKAFEPDSSKLIVLLVNAAILLVGWGIAAQLDHWPKALLWLYLPFAVVMGNCVITLLFVGHDMMHGSVIRNRRLVRVITLFSQAVLWMPPTLWKHIHNQTHHNRTNSLKDPDRNFLYREPNSLGKRAQDIITPSSTVTVPGLMLGMLTAWSLYTLRHVIAVLFFSQKECPHVPAQVTVKPAERFQIAAEFAFIVVLHLSLLAYLRFDPIKLILAYFLPIGLGYGGMIFYIYTNHLFCRMTSINDPLVNSVSLKVPKFFDLLHCNFSYHTEHHIFPGLNSDYYPLVRESLAKLYPERMRYVMTVKEAWQLLLTTPRHYLTETMFTDWNGIERVSCPRLIPSSENYRQSMDKENRGTSCIGTEKIAKPSSLVDK